MQLFLAYDTEYKQHSTSEPKTPIRAWCLLDDNGAVQESGGQTALSAVAEKVRGLSATLYVFVISPDIVAMQIPRPAGSSSKIKQALPYLLEEQLAEDVDELHFTILNPNDKTTLSIAVINRALMKECVDSLLSAGLVPQTIIPLWIALPIQEPSHWIVLLNAEYAWVRNGSFGGFSLERSQISTLIETLSEAQLPKQITWVTSENISAELEQCKKRNIVVIETSLEGKSKEKNSWLEYAAQQFKPAAGVNLLQGQFNINQQTGSERRWWILAQRLGIAIFAVWFTGLLGQYLFLRGEHFYLQTQINAVYYEAFPNATSVSSPRTIFEREIARVASGTVGTDFLSLLLRIGEVTSNYPQVQLTDIAYVQNTMTISLIADNFSRLQQLEASLREVGLTVEQEAASSTGGVVTARWKIG